MGIFDFLKSGPKSRVFLLNGVNPCPPKQFGLAAVKSAIDNSPSDVKKMYANQQTNIQQAIYRKAQGAQLVLIALHAAVVFVYALKILAVKKDVLDELHEGIINGFKEMVVNGGGENSVIPFTGLLEKMFVGFMKSLYDELSGTESEENVLDFGPTASLAVDLIGWLCEINDLLADDRYSLEAHQLKLIAATNGIMLLTELWRGNVIEYRP